MGNGADESHEYDFTRDDGYRFYLITRDATWSEQEAERKREQRGVVYGRQTKRRPGGPFRTLVEMITQAKIRRLARELELRGVCYDRQSNSRVTRVSIDSMIATIDKAGATPCKTEPATAVSSDETTRGQSVAAMLYRSIRSLANFMFPEWDQRTSKYYPGRHYMRGPGPKWREKQAQYAVRQEVQ
jgi:hypothetical protein